ncbi:nucleoside deaminase [Streptomyces sp. NPDC086549]|uniref:nucleoside deaminase n=1 Tax=Streptomyces sp. NPDC086549 TaxID=3365752 RepID=UPI0037FD4309
MTVKVTVTAIPDPWRLPFELAWEAFRAGSRPIGAVLVDADGRVVATGRNRSQESIAPAGQLVGTAIAHAEINALARLPIGRRHPGHRLYTTLEPCLLCSSALIHSHVPHVVYAAADAMWRGIEDVPGVGGTIAARWARREGPLDGPLGSLARFSELLMNLWGVLHNPEEVDEVAARAVRRCLAEADGLLDAPTAQTAYDLVRPYL